MTAAPTSRRGSSRALRTPGLVAAGRRRNRRLDWLLLRWQARLDARWADRVVPWGLAAALFVVYAAVALARIDRLDGGQVLARHVQAAWHLAEGEPPELTIGPHGNLFADRLPILFLPLAAITRVLPIATTLVVVQAAALAVGIVPVWLLARKVVLLRVGAAAALAFAYALHPAVADLDLADVNPQAFALSPLLAAFYFAEQHSWGRFAVASMAAMLWSSELGLVVATVGVILWIEGERRIGVRATVLGLGWTLFALLAVQSPLGETGLVAPGAFAEYGDGGFEVLVEMLRNPFRPVIALLEEGNVRVVVWVLGPLLFLPVLALRKLAPALPLTALVLIADVAETGPAGGARTVPLVAASFVAATFALGRLGRPSVERVIVDRRLLGLLGLAALAALATLSPVSPYEHPWEVDRPGEDDRRAAASALPPIVGVRVPVDLVAQVADREQVAILDVDERDAAVLTQGVVGLIINEADLDDLTPAERFGLRRSIFDEGMVQVRRYGDLAVYIRLFDDGDLIPGRLPRS